MFVETLGWTAGAYSACVAMPQLARVVRSRTTAGISLLAWQSSLASNLSWTVYGLLTRHVNLWLPCLLLALSAAWMLIMVARDRRPVDDSLRAVGRIDPLRIFGAPALVVVATCLLAVTAGPLAFSAAVFVPAALAQLLQLRSLMISADISAVSLPYLLMGVIGQALWFSWGVLADDISNKLVAGCLIVLAGANLAWCLLRRFDLVRPRLAGPELTGMELAGMELAGMELAGIELAGPDRTIADRPVGEPALVDELV